MRLQQNADGSLGCGSGGTAAHRARRRDRCTHPRQPGLRLEPQAGPLHILHRQPHPLRPGIPAGGWRTPRRPGVPKLPHPPKHLPGDSRRTPQKGGEGAVVVSKRRVVSLSEVPQVDIPATLAQRAPGLVAPYRRITGVITVARNHLQRTLRIGDSRWSQDRQEKGSHLLQIARIHSHRRMTPHPEAPTNNIARACGRTRRTQNAGDEVARLSAQDQNDRLALTPRARGEPCMMLLSLCAEA